jgi:hypothetical protein
MTVYYVALGMGILAGIAGQILLKAGAANRSKSSNCSNCSRGPLVRCERVSTLAAGTRPCAI